MVKPIGGFRTNDGKTFTDKADAERHEKLVEAEAEYKRAMSTYARRLFETQKTADGHPFELGLTRNYYYVAHYYDNLSVPRLVSVSFSHLDARLDEKGRDDVIVITGTNDSKMKYQITSLYRDRVNAEKALAEKQIELIHILAEKVGMVAILTPTGAPNDR